MIKSYHDFYSKKLKYPEADSQDTNEEEDEIDIVEQPNKISKINSTSISNASVSSLDEDSRSQSSASPSSQPSTQDSTQNIPQYNAANFSGQSNFYNHNSAEGGYNFHPAFGYTQHGMPGSAHSIHQNPQHNLYNTHHPYASGGFNNPAGFNNFPQQSQFRLNMNQQAVKPEPSAKNPNRNSTESSSDSLNSNSLSSPSSTIADSNSPSHFASGYYNPTGQVAIPSGHATTQQATHGLSSGLVGGHQHVGVPLLPPIINPSSLLLRVNRPGSSGEVPVKKRRPVPTEVKDNSYWEKRKKNNESAKRSRDMKRTKEEQLSMTVMYLEQENLQLRTEVGLLRAETEKMRLMLYPQLQRQQQQQHQPQHHQHQAPPAHHVNHSQAVSANIN
jgi:hypothetical protein